MKAKEWASKFEAVPASEQPAEERFAEVLAEFGKETAELVALRTKTSKPETRYPAAQGAVREQKSKWEAVCRYVPSLTPEMFAKLVDTHCPDYKQWEAAAQKKAEKKAEEDDVSTYRKNKGPGGRGRREGGDKEVATKNKESGAA